MFGLENICREQNKHDNSEGIIPHAIRYLFENVKVDEDLKIFCSFIQLYNDSAFDLVKDPGRKKPLRLAEDNGCILLLGLSEYEVNSVMECMSVLEHGDNNRASRCTNLNDVSSRSHSIFTITLESRNKRGIQKTKLNLVDLAGSEKWPLMDDLGREHVNELTNINKSLHVLGRCIQGLSKGKRMVPFRESKLTRILKESLQGKCRTLLIATLSPELANLNETISTIKFADRAKNVLLRPAPSKSEKPRKITEDLVKRLEKQIIHLKDKVKSLRYKAMKLSQRDNYAGHHGAKNTEAGDVSLASDVVHELGKKESLQDAEGESNQSKGSIETEFLDSSGEKLENIVEVSREMPKIYKETDNSENSDYEKDEKISNYENITRILKEQLFSHSRELERVKKLNSSLQNERAGENPCGDQSLLKLMAIKKLSDAFFEFRIEEDEYKVKLEDIFTSSFTSPLYQPSKGEKKPNYYSRFKLAPLTRSNSVMKVKSDIERENVISSDNYITKIDKVEKSLSSVAEGISGNGVAQYVQDLPSIS